MMVLFYMEYTDKTDGGSWDIGYEALTSGAGSHFHTERV